MRALAAGCFVLLGPALALADGAPNELGPGVLKLPVLERKAEQGILTPVPITVALPAPLAPKAARVLPSVTDPT